MLDFVDAHAGGDVGRVIVGGLGPVPGTTIAQRAEFLRREADGLRRLLIAHPYGDPSISINLVLPPSDTADVGLVIMGTMGYPSFSGSNALCTMAALFETGVVDLFGGATEVELETPGGVTTMSLSGDSGRVASVAYDAPPSPIVADRSITVPEVGRVEYSIIDSGAVYAAVDTSTTGIDPTSASVDQIAAFFDTLLTAIIAQPGASAAPLGTVDRPALGLLVGPAGGGIVPVAVYMIGGVICRGPTGTGTAAAITWLHRRGDLCMGSTLRTVSPSGEEFTATALGEGPSGLRIRISGSPQVFGRARLFVDAADLPTRLSAMDRSADQTARLLPVVE